MHLKYIHFHFSYPINNLSAILFETWRMVGGGGRYLSGGY